MACSAIHQSRLPPSFRQGLREIVESFPHGSLLAGQLLGSLAGTESLHDPFLFLGQFEGLGRRPRHDLHRFGLPVLGQRFAGGGQAALRALHFRSCFLRLAAGCRAVPAHVFTGLPGRGPHPRRGRTCLVGPLPPAFGGLGCLLAVQSLRQFIH